MPPCKIQKDPKIFNYLEKKAKSIWNIQHEQINRHLSVNHLPQVVRGFCIMHGSPCLSPFGPEWVQIFHLKEHSFDWSIIVKVRMQMEQGGVKAGTLNTCIRIVRGEGVLALYNGVGLMKTNVNCYNILMGWSYQQGLWDSVSPPNYSISFINPQIDTCSPIRQ